MQHESTMIIAVRPASALSARPRLFAALSAAFPLEFRPWPAADAGGVIVIDEDADQASVLEPLPNGMPSFHVCGDTDAAGSPERVQVLDRPAVDPRVRGIELTERLVRHAAPASHGDDDVLAAASSGAVWTRARGAAPAHRVSGVLPELGSGEVLYTLLSRRAIVTLALVHFLRAVSEPTAWSAAPLRASFVFDDPNLRWRRYGFIDYKRLLTHADVHGYHAAMAIVPLDARRGHRPTVSLFKERPDRLSLVVHGNDHTRQELLRPRPPASALALAAQAITRIERFERRSGLPVDRIMMPPHGMCSEEVAGALGAVGFDALCAIHPLPWDERPPGSPLLAGWRPGEYVGGCAIISRLPMTATVADIALQAFLGHPIVMYGHHDDVADGLEPLAQAAARVNHLGDVAWTSVADIAHSNYAQRLQGDCAVIRPYSRRLTVRPPDGAFAVSVQAPAEPYGPLGLRGWSLASEDVVRPFGSKAALTSGAPVEVRLIGAGDIDPGRVSPPSWRPWPAMRRAGAELRDRALPLRPLRTR